MDEAPKAVLKVYADIIHAVRPDASHLSELGAGDVNEVILVDNKEVFRFPKNEDGKDALRYETMILRRVAGKTSLDVPVPIELADDASYGVFTFVRGNVLDNKTIDTFSLEQKVQAGHAIAAFIQALNTALPLAETAQPHFESESAYHAHMLRLGEAEDNPYLFKYQRYYKQLCERFGGSLPKENMVAHGDLHSGNLVFTDENKLCGIIDFSDCGPSTIYGELRQMYRLGDTILTAIVEGLGDDFGAIDLDLVRLWAITHEFSVMMRPGALTGENERAVISQKLLQTWLGDTWRNQ